MMKLGELVRRSEPLRKINSKLVRLVGYKTGVDRNEIPTVVCKTWTPLEYIIGNKIRRSADQNKYTSSIKFLDRKYNIKCSCSCPDFMYRWEWANNQVGAADIIFGNGDPPDIQNPGHVPGMCKHLLRLRTEIKRRHGV